MTSSMAIRLLLISIISIITMGSSGFAQEQGVFIVNLGVPVDSLNIDEIEDIFVGNKTHWKGNFKIDPCVMSYKTALGKHFLNTIMDMSHREYVKLWLRKTFSGSSPPPQVFKSAEQVIQYVSERDGGIGFIPLSMAEDLTNCKVILVGQAKSF